MVQTKITLTLEPHDLKLINEGLLLLLVKLEDEAEHPEDHIAEGLGSDRKQLEMFSNDSKVRASEVRAICSAIN